MAASPETVVVGAGPVGLVAACELARRGIAVRVIDKLPEPTTQSRAIAVHARSLDMFDRMGIVEGLIATGVTSTGMKMLSNSKELFHVRFGGVDSAFPYTLLTPQTETERVLRERLSELGGTVEQSVALVGMTQGPGGVALTLRHGDGAIETVDTPWVVGADGSHSTVRHLVGATLHGSFKGERFILGDCDAESDLDPEAMYTVLAPEGPVIMMPMKGGRARLMAEIHDQPGAALDLHPTQENLQKILDERVGGVRITASHWLTCFEIHHGQVPAYRYDRAFLVGDAAHIHSPAGGQGMNTGMQDAFNLAWKLAARIRGDGGTALLDSYQVERYPVAERVIAFTRALTTAGTLRGGARAVRNALMRAVGNIPGVGDTMAGVVEEVGIGYQGSPVVLDRRPRRSKVIAGAHLPHLTDPRVHHQLSLAFGPESTGHTVLTVAPGRPAAVDGCRDPQVLITPGGIAAGDGTGYDTVIDDPDGVAAKRYGLEDGGRIVVRPDRYIGAVVALDDDAGVAEYFAQLAR